MQELTIERESFVSENISSLEGADPFALPSGIQTKFEIGSSSGSDCGNDYIIPDLVARDFVEEEVKPVLHIELREDPSRIGDIGAHEEEDPLAFSPKDSLVIEELRNANQIKSEVQDEQTEQLKQDNSYPETDSYMVQHTDYSDTIGEIGLYKKEEPLALSTEHTFGYEVQMNVQKLKNNLQHERSHQLELANTQPYTISPTNETDASFAVEYNILSNNYKNEACANEKSDGVHNNLTSQPKQSNNVVTHCTGSRQAEPCNDMNAEMTQHSSGTGCNQTHMLSNKLCLAKLKTLCNKKQFKCVPCKKYFSYYSQLDNHNRIHTGERPYQCKVCKQSFNQKSILKRHSQTHTGERPYECDVCKQSFSIMTRLTAHSRTHSGDRPYQCDVCKQSFNQKSHLNIHSRTHTGERPYQCDVCKQSFNQKCNLNTHTRTHTGERPYQCDVCKQSFNQKSYLNKHIRTHTGERPYQCDVCKQSFHRKSSLNIHTRTHTGERPYQCDVCKQSFIHKSVLNIHSRTHTGERPYQCDVCNHSFKHKPSLLKHCHTHTG